MKLLIYSHFFAPSIGGVETIVLSLARGLAELRDLSGKAQFELTLVTQTPASNYDDAALPFRVIRQPGLIPLWRLIRGSDLVHVAGPALAPLFLTRLARKTLVIEHHGYQATCPNGLLFHHPSQSVCRGHFEAGNYLECLRCNRTVEGSAGALRLLASAFLRRAGSRGAATNIAPSDHVATRQDLPRTKVILHGVEESPRWGVIPPGSAAFGARSFAYLGRLVIEKGVSVLLEASRLLRAEGCEVEVVLIGDGPDRVRLERQIASSRPKNFVRITGFLSGAALDLELAGVSALVIPTIMEETAGLAAIEQMMRGRLVIASKTGGLAEVVGDAGLTFPPGDAAALAGRMREVLQDPSIVDSIGRKARGRACQMFLRARMVEEHARVYRSVLLESHATVNCVNTLR
jgi:glycosyltransferase involved in cell wall biosynthesis